jgi:hypothetical protein
VYCVLLFPESSEVQWLERVPKPGTRIRTVSGRTRVVEVLQSGRNTYTVICGIRDGPPDAPPTLATELLELARRKVDEGRHLGRYRNYIP